MSSVVVHRDLSRRSDMMLIRTASRGAGYGLVGEET